MSTRTTAYLQRDSALRKIRSHLALATAAKDDDKVRGRLRSVSTDLDSIQQDFQKGHNSILYKMTDPNADLDEQYAMQEEFDGAFYTIKSICHDLFERTNPIPIQPAPNVKLPKLSLNTFDGKIKNFPTFIDLFNSLIHNNSALSDIEKFSYLLSSLEKEPLSLIKTLPITNSNYAIAYKTLVDRFSNQRALASACWRAIDTQPKLNSESAYGLRNLLDVFTENLDSLKTLKLPVLQWDFVLFNMLIKRLDSATIKRFELQYASNEIPKYTELKSFLEKQCTALETVSYSMSKEGSSNPNSQKHVSKFESKPFRSKPASFFVETNNTQKCTCSCCGSDHNIYKCQTFNGKSPKDRYTFAKQHNMCINCLSKLHNFRNCKSLSRCLKCKSPHHTLLHFDNNDSTQAASNAPPMSLTAIELPRSSTELNVPASTSTFNNTVKLNNVLLSTAIIAILDSEGKRRPIRILIDCCSQANFITSECLRQLGLKKQNFAQSIQCLGGTNTVSQGAIFCSLFPANDDNFKFDIQALVVDTISQSMPSEFICIKSYEHLKNLKLADPKFNIPAKIDMLIGAEIFPHILLGSVKHGKQAQHPSAIQTVFGWIMMGNTAINKFHVNKLNNFFLVNTLDDTLKRFWALEEVSTAPLLSHEEILCEKIYSETHMRDVTGRYIVNLPFRDSSPKVFSDSRNIAFRRLISLERRLMNNLPLYKDYCDFMRDYLNNGHMQLVVKNSENLDNSYYIPHHCVVKHNDSKLRVVFDGSCKTAQGFSLNDMLLTGQKLHNDLASLLLKFRVFTYVFTTDIKSMFLQILVNPSHRNYQRILWRFSKNDPVLEYELTSVIFGLSSSPHLANRTILQLCQDETENFPLACKMLPDCIYVDDIATGSDNLTDALELQSQFISLLKSGGFELRKWGSNHHALLDNIPEEYKLRNPSSFDSQHDFIKILGLQWLPSLDSFSYKINIRNEACTKRAVLSEIARIFDPIGFLAPLTFFAKYLIQYLWTLGLGWDEPTPPEIQSRWEQYKSQLPCLETLQIPRQLIFENKYASCELHGFADSSEKGYAAVAYFRFERPDGEVHVTLVSAKTKVAPLKRISIPKLELCAAVLLSDLLEFILNTYSNLININNVYAYTDSTVALAWIRSSPHRWQTFVSNRVSHIQNKISPNLWFHISGNCNPADPASRGLLPSELLDNTLWWAGCPWLRSGRDTWPIDSNTSNIKIPEEKSFTFAAVVEMHLLDTLLSKFSSLSKIKTIIAYIIRFTHNSRFPHERKTGVFNEYELHDALLVLVKYAQQISFNEDIKKLANNNPLSKSLRKLNPFIDNSGLLRVGGRLTHSQLEYDQKFPILLPRAHRLTYLIIEDCHRKHLHVGLNALHFLLLQHFWILSPKRAIRHCLSHCYRCFRVKPVHIQPFMGDLPSFRISEIKSFNCSGVDYAGPFAITLSKHRGVKTQKAYICLFVCAATKAVHLELASDLSMEAFLAALRRFISRRGKITHIFSDCGSNFVAAKREIEFFQQATEHEKIKWSLNPPSGSHFGGLFESGVKSVKNHIYRVVGQQVLTYEEFYTLLVQIEAVLNSRPLCPLSTDPTDLAALTPGHFLTLAPLTVLPEPDLTSLNISRLNRWQLLQRMHQDFWKRWHVEYLHTLQQREKWTNKTENIKIGALVLIKNENLSPLVWRMGRVVELHRGEDGICRVVTLRTSNGLFKRPVVKLCPLPNN